MLRRLASSAALVATAALLLVGCTPPEPTETTAVPSRSQSGASSPTPVDPLEALQAEAVSVATRFLRLTDQGFASGTLPSDELRAVASDALVAQLETEVAAFAMQGLTVQGHSRLDSHSLVGLASPPPPDEPFELMACVDTSDVVTTDEAGEQVSGGVTRQPRIFAFAQDDAALVITATTPPASGTELAGCAS